MIVDAHSHVVMPEAPGRFMAGLLASRPNPIEDPKLPSDESLRPVTERHIQNMDKVGTDVQFISPRPYAQLHSLNPSKVTQTWTRYVNDLIHRQCQLFPERLGRGGGRAQHRGSRPQGGP